MRNSAVTNGVTELGIPVFEKKCPSVCPASQRLLAAAGHQALCRYPDAQWLVLP